MGYKVSHFPYRKIYLNTFICLSMLNFILIMTILYNTTLANQPVICAITHSPQQGVNSLIAGYDNFSMDFVCCIILIHNDKIIYTHTRAQLKFFVWGPTYAANLLAYTNFYKHVQTHTSIHTYNLVFFIVNIFKVFIFNIIYQIVYQSE